MSYPVTLEYREKNTVPVSVSFWLLYQTVSNVQRCLYNVTHKCDDCGCMWMYKAAAGCTTVCFWFWGDSALPKECTLYLACTKTIKLKYSTIQNINMNKEF